MLPNKVTKNNITKNSLSKCVLQIVGSAEFFFLPGIQWSSQLNEYAWQYNTGAHQSLGNTSPFEIFYGRAPKISEISTSVTEEEEIEEFGEKQNWLCECNEIQQRACAAQDKASKNMR